MEILSPTPDVLDRAATALRSGGVVVIPTETVYGLACNALDADAVRRVFAIKGRPANNPLIVHVASEAQARQVTSAWPESATVLAARFWPGPLTMVLPRAAVVPDVTAADLDTVAVRMPAHPVALELIRRAGVPLAAPSANPFMRLSPTRAEDVDPSIVSQVTMVLDGGPCDVGLESTVVDLSGTAPMVLRPGGIPRAALEAALVGPWITERTETVTRSPGMHPRHYAPRATIRLVASTPPGAAGLVFSAPANPQQIRMPSEPQAYGAMLYAALRRLDLLGVAEIFVVTPPSGDAWEAVHDRLRRASTALDAP
ncbi:MAG: threonylcarbamoyl-AMP synthase [Gemmatimonadaceae bacterium]|nr:threonylcarbamoyl-AMP synthase [Gemmatimonadaceae bacterium]